MANKLTISKPCTADLASLSSHPLYGRSASRRSLTGPRYSTSSSYQRETSASIGPPQPPLLCGSAGNSQSQQSFSQGLAFSQPFSQLSQDEPTSLNLFEDWRSTKDGKQVGASNPPPSSQNSNQSSTNIALSRANNLIQKLNQKHLPQPLANFSLSKEQLEKRLETLDEGLSKVITVLDSMEGDLQKLSTAVQNASLDTEGIKQKIIAQEHSLQVLLKEEEHIKTTLTTSLKKLSEKKEESIYFETLSDKIHMIPITLTRHLAIIKKDLFTCIHDELQTIRECIHNSIQTEGYSTANKSHYQDLTEVDSDKKNDRNKTTSNKKKDTERQRANTRRDVKDTEKRQYKKTKADRGTAKLSDGSKTINAAASPERNQRPGRKTPTVTNTNQDNPTRKRGRQAHTRKSNQNLLSNAMDNDRTLRSGTGCKKDSSLTKRTNGKKDPIFGTQIKNHRVSEYTFEMEDDLEDCVEEDTVSVWQTGNVSWFEGEFGMEEEIKEMRRKIMKARKDRQRSASISSSD